MSEPIVSVGIDVGGQRKGFHAVSLRDRTILDTISSRDPAEIATWCAKIGASIVAVDAPISWSKTGRARPAELALMRQGVWCFSTPTEQAARAHRTDHFGWMLQGMKLYRALGTSFARFDGRNGSTRPIYFETFPHAIVCALKGQPVRARDKRRVRRALVATAGISCECLTNIDLIDAALCALTAHYFARSLVTAYGDADDGFIVVPRPVCSPESLPDPQVDEHVP